MSILSFIQSLKRGAKSECDQKSAVGNLHTRNDQAVPRPWTYDPVHSLYLTKGYTVKLKAGTKKVTLLRFLIAKLAYGRVGEGLSVEEYLVLMETSFALLDSKDPNFAEKWKSSILKVANFIPALSEIREFPVVLNPESRQILVDYFREDPILPNPEAYFGLLGQRDLRDSFRVRFNSSWIPPKRVERYIGVGYKDKGSRRYPELDGSPSWQEVATVLANREREQEEAGSAYFAPTGE